MPISLYIDEDAMARLLVRGLRAREIDVTTVFEEGMTGKSDEEQLSYAAEHGRTFYTFNVGDFCRLHTEYLTQGNNHAGIIVVYRKRYAIGEQIRRLSDLIQKLSSEEISNNLIFL